MDSMESQTEREVFYKFLRLPVPSGRIILIIITLLGVALFHSYPMFILVGLWVFLAFMFSCGKFVSAYQVQVRRLMSLIPFSSNSINLEFALGDEQFAETDYDTLISFDETHTTPIYKPKGLNTQKIKALPSSIVSPEWLSQAVAWPGFTTECIICLESYVDGEMIRKLACGHCYHLYCIDMWLDHAVFCPICNSSVMSV